jgi:hypothetical protein
MLRANHYANLETCRGAWGPIDRQAAAPCTVPHDGPPIASSMNSLQAEADWRILSGVAVNF